VTGKTVAGKLLVKPGTRVWASSADGLALVGPLPPGARVVATIGEADVALLFAESAVALEQLLEESADALHRPDILWIAYPKAGKSDLKRDTIPPHLTRRDMRPIGQVAIDEVWSALRFRPLKPGEAPFTGRSDGA
jgi:hypothetical protein